MRAPSCGRRARALRTELRLVSLQGLRLPTSEPQRDLVLSRSRSARLRSRHHPAALYYEAVLLPNGALLRRYPRRVLLRREPPVTPRSSRHPLDASMLYARVVASGTIAITRRTNPQLYLTLRPRQRRDVPQWARQAAVVVSSDAAHVVTLRVGARAARRQAASAAQRRSVLASRRAAISDSSPDRATSISAAGWLITLTPTLCVSLKWPLAEPHVQGRTTHARLWCCHPPQDGALQGRFQRELRLAEPRLEARTGALGRLDLSILERCTSSRSSACASTSLATPFVSTKAHAIAASVRSPARVTRQRRRSLDPPRARGRDLRRALLRALPRPGRAARRAAGNCLSKATSPSTLSPPTPLHRAGCRARHAGAVAHPWRKR